MASRTHKEKLMDCLLLLYQIKDAFKYTDSLPKTKLQKIVFLSEKSMLDKREKGFNFNYIKLNYGTYSQELAEDLAGLIKMGLIDHGFQPTSLGSAVLEDFKDIFTRNKTIVEKIEEVNKQYAKMSLKDLLNFVHNMPHPYLRGSPKIEDLKPRTPILYRIPQEKARSSFQVCPEETATLEIYFDPESLDSLISASESAKKGPLLKFEEVS
jgi:uncharacterized protein YwgA